MAGHMLLINPARKRRRKNAMPEALKRYWARRRRGSRALSKNPQRRRRRNVLTAPTWARALSSNPRRRRHHVRRRNPMHAYRRRRRNPIPGMAGIVGMFKDAAIQSLGSVAIDYAYGYVNGMLPATMKRTPGTIGVGDAVKFLFVALAGSMLSKPTRGMSRAAATGSLTIDFRKMIEANLPTTVTQQLAWYQPSPMVQGTQWTSASRGVLRRNSPLLSGVGAFVRSGFPTLSGMNGVVGAPTMPNVVSVPSAIPFR
jgi:hypothetical protein